MRKLLLPLLTLAAVTLFLGPPAVAAGTLRILAYEGYADDDWIKAFEHQTGARVNVVFAGSPEEMFAKMQGSAGADYDLVAIDTSIVKRYLDNGLIQPMDASKLTNLPNLQPAFAGIPQTKPDGKRYAVPIAWGSLGLVYSLDEFKEAPTSWNVLWDPKYKGRVPMGDDGNNNIVNTALSMGIADPYHLSDEQAKAVKKKLIDLKSNLLSYYSGGEEGVTLYQQNDIVLMTAFGELQYRQLQSRGLKVGSGAEGGGCRLGRLLGDQLQGRRRRSRPCLDQFLAPARDRPGDVGSLQLWQHDLRGGGLRLRRPAGLAGGAGELRDAHPALERSEGRPGAMTGTRGIRHPARSACRVAPAADDASVRR